jgi:hypothetical protein
LVGAETGRHVIKRVGSRLPPKASALGNLYLNHFLLPSKSESSQEKKTFAMSALSFAFSPEATAKVHDALICLAKFGETVCMEARGDMVNPKKCSRIFPQPADTFLLAHSDYIELIKNIICLLCPGCEDIFLVLRIRFR